MLMLAIEFSKIIIPAALLLLIAALFATLIVVLAKKLVVQRDERIDEVKAHLSGANCGGCGYPGCDAFAEALVAGKTSLNACNPTSTENKKIISQLLGSEEAVADPTRAIVFCAGGNRCREKYEYQGYGDCRTAELLSGGRKACDTACIGLGTCVDVCPAFAVEVNATGYSEVKPDKCISCGKCVAACPKRVIRRIRKSAKVYCACSNKGRGKEVRDVCTVGCTGCTLCSKVCPHGAITMLENLPQFDYDKCTACGLCVEKCPSKCILKID